ncbi:hypothetical protein K461DRAFT_298157 [Myriangium duriaei CBS 260.36]|uniref:Uncharacterized protein n=1 Tax=Myriangium duriaei CBS 260.36 TaxID=1168546 RepID=A0A9P4IQ59_9PEZI|nr:hypothetical protein K461DRAFT_298157 [Myriangium duriaei CBS 260.36]
MKLLPIVMASLHELPIAGASSLTQASPGSRKATSSCPAALTAPVKAFSSQNYAGFCSTWLSFPASSRAISTITGLNATQVTSACGCLGASATTLTSLSKTCVAADVAAIKKDFFNPTNFCKYYQSLGSTLSSFSGPVIDGLTSAQIYNACQCILPFCSSNRVVSLVTGPSGKDFCYYVVAPTKTVTTTSTPVVTQTTQITRTTTAKVQLITATTQKTVHVTQNATQCASQTTKGKRDSPDVVTPVAVASSFMTITQVVSSFVTFTAPTPTYLAGGPNSKTTTVTITPSTSLPKSTTTTTPPATTITSIVPSATGPLPLANVTKITYSDEPSYTDTYAIYPSLALTSSLLNASLIVTCTCNRGSEGCTISQWHEYGASAGFCNGVTDCMGVCSLFNLPARCKGWCTGVQYNGQTGKCSLLRGGLPFSNGSWCGVGTEEGSLAMMSQSVNVPAGNVDTIGEEVQGNSDAY